MTLQELGEDALVKQLLAGLPSHESVRVGPGDDCAVVQVSAGTLLLKTDAMVEGVHFLRSTEPERIGRKALARAISDMGAMGGRPAHALITLMAPADLEVDFVLRMYAGLSQLASEYRVAIVGGETTRSPLIILNVALTGHASHPVLRSRGQVGDLLAVTGSLGGSIRGKHLDFTPRVREGTWLAEQGLVHAMMDLSDGLAKDLPRLAKASACGFAVDDSSLPLSESCSVEQAWSDGEDYELLFTCSQAQWEVLQTTWPEGFAPLHRIGHLTSQPIHSRPGGWDAFD
jgi:thiamine-monophosphate kinase